MFAPATTLSKSFATAGLSQPRKKRTSTTAQTKATKEKKPPSAYNLYMKEVFPLAKAATPGADLGTLSKTVSSQWKALDEVEKKKYQAASAAAKATWEATQPAGASPAVQEPATPKRRVKKDPAAPKKPPSGYAAFVKAQFSQHTKPGQSAPETMKTLSAEWKKLSDTQKAQYKSTQ